MALEEEQVISSREQCNSSKDSKTPNKSTRDVQPIQGQPHTKGKISSERRPNHDEKVPHVLEFSDGQQAKKKPPP
ncbi:hypothetical protein V6N11_035399 [Hibiscus sabdariffa]|uniref:Uncharacterized protein n=1 Tax=Hibiscus sabdariffa TaxID=183260 RepID=A0ABR2R054_9ROSI